MSPYPIPCNANMPRAKPGNFLDIWKQGHGGTDLVPGFCSGVLYGFSPTHGYEFLFLHSDYLFVSGVLSQLICNFDTASIGFC